MASIPSDNFPARTSSVNFVCQRCAQPLKLHSSFSTLDEQTYSGFSIPDNNGSDVLEQWDKGSDNGISRRSIPPVRYSANENGVAMAGFTMVEQEPSESSQESGGNSIVNSSLAMGQAAIANLFDILSDQSGVDHPLCEECTDILLDHMDAQLRAAEDECHEYKEFLEKFDQQQPQESDIPNMAELEEELLQLQETEAKLVAELERGEAKEKELAAALEAKQVELEALKEEDAAFWHNYSQHSFQLARANDALESVECQLKYAKAHLDRLSKTNVFNATFHIWHNGHFGTINNFRLGRLKAVPVEWEEINAAWGQAVLLLHSLATKMKLTFSKYRLVPYGSHSFIESREDRSKELPLYGMGGVKFFWDTKFDAAMTAFLECLDEFKVAVEKEDRNFHLPYKIDKFRIVDATANASFAIRAQLNSPEGWTKALKFMLTNLKWGLAWVASHYKDDF